jgi:8-oxo-dGTP diphosphatase
MKISDGAKIFIKNEKLNKYIFILRDNKDSIPYPNEWEFIGGRIEKEEIPIDALKREVKEELNIDIYDIQHLDSRDVVHKLENKEFKIKGHYYTGKTDISDLSNIVLTEGQEVKFFSIKEILSKFLVKPYESNENRI